MKYIVVILAIFNITLTAHAGSGDMGGGRAFTAKKIAIPNNLIDGVVSKDGIYSRLIDIQEGYENFEGIQVTPTQTIFDLKKPSRVDLDILILNNGWNLNLDALRVLDGGDMGGG